MTSTEATTLEDVVILGRAAPETISGGRQTVCTGAWSEHRGFIRLYPIDPQSDLFNRWDVIDVEVRRNPQDTRVESWKLARPDQESCVTKTGEFPRERRATLLYHLEDDCVKDINDARRSLGIIRPESIDGFEFRSWEKDDNTVQSQLFEDMGEWRPDSRDDFGHEIRIEFTCGGCETKQGYHNKTLLEWGAYLAKAKNHLQNEDELEPFYNLRDDDYRHWIFVGNQANQRTSFIAINLIWMKADHPIHDTLEEYRKVPDDFDPEDV
ncbi:hypothetical protein [Natrinema sp. 1APR25-10V2]|uniref:hypothetical protein n=1 Tax=Natrinema sp. 1APR25-10V2 TaxID=2951081 RepID=UPI0028762914|nr:hypothetical protein [Natrinema sp. 1APR25-10V2]MDS0474583.1 hypothetical protein [Natrinema sp. 1APR25-10V2]